MKSGCYTLTRPDGVVIGVDVAPDEDTETWCQGTYNEYGVLYIERLFTVHNNPRGVENG